MIDFFNKKAVGLEIADTSLEAAEVIKSGAGFKVLKLARVSLAPGIVVRGRIKDKRKLKKEIKKLFSRARPSAIKAKKIVFALPESQVYLRFFGLKEQEKEIFMSGSAKDREAFIFELAAKHIPLPQEELLTSYQLIDEERGSFLLAGVSKNLLGEWQQFFKELLLEIETFDIESLATMRALFPAGSQEDILLVNIGGLTTNLTFVGPKGLYYSCVIEAGGEVWTKEIAQALSLTPKEAEKLKIKKALKDENSPVFSILVKELERIKKEIDNLLNYFFEETGKKPKKLILLGGSGKLKGIKSYFEANISLPVEIGRSSVLNIKKKKPLEYLQAIGSALRELDKKWQRQPGFSFNRFQKTAFPSEKNISIRSDEAEENGFVSLARRDRADKLKSKKILLAAVIAIGALAVILAFWYRGRDRQKRQETIKEDALQYQAVQTLTIEIPLALSSGNGPVDKDKVRIIEETIFSAGTSEEALAHALQKAEKKLEEAEILWPSPLEQIRPEDSSFPIIFKWLVYSREVEEIFLEKVDKINREKVDYRLNRLLVNGVRQTDNPHLFYLKAEVTLSLNRLIDVEERFLPESSLPPLPEETPLEPEEETIMVVIQPTGTGWLRVRSGPGTGYSEIGRVYPGQSFVLLEETIEWYKIELEGKEGWIFSSYGLKE